MENQNPPKEESKIAPSESEGHRRLLQTKKKSIFLIGFLAFLTVILFIPIPYYLSEGRILCKPNSPCPSPGWNLGPSLARQIKDLLFPDVTYGPPSEQSFISTPIPTPNPTANWKTFNSSFGYSVQYPLDTILVDCEGHCNYGSQLKNKDLLITFVPAGLPKNKPIADHVDKGFCFPSHNGIKEQQINGINFYRTQKYFSSTNICLNAVTTLPSYKSSEQSYWVIDIQGKANNQNGLKLFDQILSTFKFLDDDQNLDWKTYSSKEGFYTIDYPATYKVQHDIASPISSKSPNLISSIQFNAPCNFSYENQSDSCGGLEMYHVIVSVEKNLNNLDIDNWLKTSDLAPLKQCKRIDPRVKINKQNFLGSSAVVYDYVSDPDSVYGCAHDEIVGDWQTGFIKEIVIFRKQNIYKISVFYTLKDKIFVRDLLKIPETLKFLD